MVGHWSCNTYHHKRPLVTEFSPCYTHRKRKTALACPLAGEENLQLLTMSMDQPSSKRRKQVEEEEEDEAGIGCSARRSAFLPVSQSVQMDVGAQSGDTPTSSLNVSVSESSSVSVEDHWEQNTYIAAQQQCPTPSWHKLATPPVTQWKKLTLPSNYQEEERSAEGLALKQDDHVSKSVYNGSSSESEHTKKEGGAVSVRTNTIRLPDILTDTESVSSTDEQTNTYSSRTSTPALDSSLQPSPISPTPKQQLLMRLRRRYTSGLSPAPVESWDRYKSRLLNKEVRMHVCMCHTWRCSGVKFVQNCVSDERPMILKHPAVSFGYSAVDLVFFRWGAKCTHVRTSWELTFYDALRHHYSLCTVFCRILIDNFHNFLVMKPSHRHFSANICIQIQCIYVCCSIHSKI